jgi:hypothetical protein
MKNQSRSGRRRRSTVAFSAVGVTLAATAMSGLGAGVANASSHREAPLTAGDPQHDNTDVYAFTSPDDPNSVSLVANWIPFEEPNGGPNFYPWKAGSHYDINIDSKGTGKPDITYRWIFTDDRTGQTNADHGDAGKGTFLYNDGVVKSPLKDSKTLLFKQTYVLQEIRNGGQPKTIASGTAAPSDVGKASMPDYASLRTDATSAVAGGGQTVATQAADPFFLDLRVFDLLYGANLKEAGHNTLAGYNVNSVVLKVPKSALALNGNMTKNPVIGVWSSTEKQNVTLSGGKETANGNFVQVSRLGNPLVNELVIPVALKDAFNSLTPDQDHTVAAAVQKVTDPELPKLIQAIYGMKDPSLKAPPTPRNDLKEIFLTGVCKACGPIKADLNSQMLNKDVASGSFVPAEELRLNMGVPVSSNPSRLGVLGKDLQGFPNGRRLNDDVVDIEILAVEGTAMTGKIPPALMAGDGVNGPASAPSNTFPYLALPNTASVNQAGSGSSSGMTMPSGGVATGAGGTAVQSSSMGVAPVAATLAGFGLVGFGAFTLRRSRRNAA